MTKKPELPIKSQDVRKLTDEEYEKLARGLLVYLELSGGKEVTWRDIEKVAQAVLGKNPRSPDLKCLIGEVRCRLGGRYC